MNNLFFKNKEVINSHVLKVFISITIFSLISFSVASQRVGINDAGTSPDQSAILDVDSQDKGFLPPRLTSSQMLSISNPARGLMAFNINVGCMFFVNNNDEWQSMCDNSIVSLPVADFTTDNLIICENNCINFTDASTGVGINAWSWTFNGATPSSSSAQNPANICFPTAGTYDIDLDASNVHGTVSKTYQISVNNCVSCVHTGLALGDIYQGGVIFDLKTDPNGCQSGKIVSLYAQNSNNALEWGGSGTYIGVTDEDDGFANSNSIVSALGSGTYAAKVCRDYTDGVYTDWYLPAKSEMLALFNVKSAINAVISGAGGNQITSLFYWTSTEVSSISASRIHFNDGTFSSLPKSNTSTYRARAIRSF